MIKKRKQTNRNNAEEEAKDYEEDKETENDIKIGELQSKILELTEKLERNQRDKDDNVNYSEILSNLYDKGIIDEDGKVVEFNHI